MGKTILITGASTGIGAATARHLASENTLLLHYHRTSITSTAEATRGLGAETHCIQADLMTEAGCRVLAQAVAERTPSLDVLINNAGNLFERHTVSDLRWDLMEQIFALNTFSAMLLTHLCAPLLRKGADASIVNITSVAARHGAPSATIYGAAKGALDSFTRGSARELAPDIRVNAVAPGIILTPFHERYTPEDKLAELQKITPVGFHGHSDHVARAVEFLINNTFVTGETIDVNGGIFMR